MGANLSMIYGLFHLFTDMSEPFTYFSIQLNTDPIQSPSKFTGNDI